MRGFYWLASYPKSGNTWFRMLAANLGAEEEPADINAVPAPGGIASGRGQFEAATLIDSGLLTHEEADRLRPAVYAAIEGDEAGNPPRFVKAHDAYVSLPDGTPLFGRATAAAGVILIVRDPRDVAPSLANHLDCGLDEAIAFMANAEAVLASTRRGQSPQLRQRLLDWGGHVASWLDQRDVPVCLVRYEDLAADPARTLQRAMAFARRPIGRTEAAQAAEWASFARLQEREAAQGFAEWRSRGDGSRFFRRGESGGWRRELDAAQARAIEAAHGATMARLGYQCEFTRQHATVEGAQ
jgi:hypothetical protein